MWRIGDPLLVVEYTKAYYVHFYEQWLYDKYDGHSFTWLDSGTIGKYVDESDKMVYIALEEGGFVEVPKELIWPL